MPRPSLLERLRQRLREEVPLAPPHTAAVNLAPVQYFPEVKTARVRLLGTAEVSEDLASLVAHLCDDRFELAAPEVQRNDSGDLERPATVDLASGEFAATQISGDLFATLGPVALEGRTFELPPPGTDETPRARRAKSTNPLNAIQPQLLPPLDDQAIQPDLFPPGRKPYDFQIRGIEFLINHQAALLGDEMGLGKTIQTIVALQVLFRRGSVHRALILCRRSMLGTWEHELQTWAPELSLLVVRGDREMRDQEWRASASVFLTTYETAREDIQRDAFLLPHFDVVLLDEAQEIKNPSAQKSRAIRMLTAAYRWGLSGTPVENRPDDVVAIFRYILPGLFRNTVTYSPDEIQQRIKPHFLRRRASDVLQDLPDKVYQEVWVDLTPEQQASYDEVYAEAQETLTRPDATRVHVFSLLNELRQICNQDPDTGVSCKLEYLHDQLEDIIANGYKALVFSTFPNKTLRSILPHLRPFAPAIFDGTLDDRHRQALINTFQERETPKVLLMSVKAGSVGITLTRANHVFHFDHWWNPATSRQAEARAHRIGQEQTVFIYDIYTKNTIEERMRDLLGKKEVLFKNLIDDLSTPYVRESISDEDLFGLFDLKPPRG